MVATRSMRIAPTTPRTGWAVIVGVPGTKMAFGITTTSATAAASEVREREDVEVTATAYVTPGSRPRSLV